MNYSLQNFKNDINGSFEKEFYICAIDQEDENTEPFALFYFISDNKDELRLIEDFYKNTFSDSFANINHNLSCSVGGYSRVDDYKRINNELVCVSIVTYKCEINIYRLWQLETEHLLELKKLLLDIAAFSKTLPGVRKPSK